METTEPSNCMVKITQCLGSWIVSSTDSKLARDSRERLCFHVHGSIDLPLGGSLSETSGYHVSSWGDGASLAPSKEVHAGMRASTPYLQFCNWGGPCFPASGFPSSRSPHHWKFQECFWVPQCLTHCLPQRTFLHPINIPLLHLTNSYLAFGLWETFYPHSKLG